MAVDPGNLQAHTRAVLVDLDVWAGDIYAGSLPQICVFTGDPTPGVHSVRYSTFPRWVWALLFAGFLPFIIGVALTRRTVTGTLPMNARALRRFVVQRLATVGIVVVIPILCFVAAALADRSSSDATGALAGAGFAVFFFGAVACMLWGGAIGIGGTVEDRAGWGRWVRLRGVNPTFASAVQRMYAGRMPQWQIGTVPTSFARVPLPNGYAPAPSPPGWVPPSLGAGPAGTSSPPMAPPAAR
ncbi:MAG: hypothetical protein M3Z57_07035 [Candidatus Dormibacteraeota bacterium]|nr:hypothetical protein [Candidatus Dormibacteraeota bacterium]